MSKRIFISYDYETDGDFINGIKGMLNNPEIDIDFYNESITEPIDSSNSDYIKRRIKEKIERSSMLLCIVGKNTHSSEWVKWEIKTALDLHKKIVFMRRKDDTSSMMQSITLGYKTIINWDIEYLKNL